MFSLNINIYNSDISIISDNGVFTVRTPIYSINRKMFEFNSSVLYYEFPTKMIRFSKATMIPENYLKLNSITIKFLFDNKPIVVFNIGKSYICKNINIDTKHFEYVFRSYKIILDWNIDIPKIILDKSDVKSIGFKTIREYPYGIFVLQRLYNKPVKMLYTVNENGKLFVCPLNGHHIISNYGYRKFSKFSKFIGHVVKTPYTNNFGFYFLLFDSTIELKNIKVSVFININSLYIDFIDVDMKTVNSYNINTQKLYKTLEYIKEYTDNKNTTSISMWRNRNTCPHKVNCKHSCIKGNKREHCYLVEKCKCGSYINTYHQMLENGVMPKRKTGKLFSVLLNDYKLYPKLYINSSIKLLLSKHHSILYYIEDFLA